MKAQRSVVLSVKDPEEALDRLEAERNKRTEWLWTMKDGSTIPLCDMTDEHLDNAISMLERKLAISEQAKEEFGEW